MIHEDIQAELAELRKQREVALINLYRLDGAIVALESILQKHQVPVHAPAPDAPASPKRADGDYE